MAIRGRRKTKVKGENCCFSGGSAHLALKKLIEQEEKLRGFRQREERKTKSRKGPCRSAHKQKKQKKGERRTGKTYKPAGDMLALQRPAGEKHRNKLRQAEKAPQT